MLPGRGAEPPQQTCGADKHEALQYQTSKRIVKGKNKKLKGVSVGGVEGGEKVLG